MKISVVMPVYNGEKYLKEAIDSILNQTYTDFEFIIINDCSNDSTEDIIRSYADKRIRYIKNEKNLGVALSLNRGLDEANGEYIARMDADDISLPERFKKQLDLMEEHTEIAVCGSDIIKFTDDGQEERISFVGDSDRIKIGLLFNSALAHSTVMMRKIVLENNRFRYDPAFEKAEDFELWTRIASKYRMTNINEPLLRYRVHSLQVSSTFNEKQIQASRQIRSNNLRSIMGDKAEKYIDTFDAFSNGSLNDEAGYKNLTECFKIIISNNKSYDSKKLKEELYLIKNNIALNKGYRLSVQEFYDLCILMKIKLSRLIKNN